MPEATKMQRSDVLHRQSAGPSADQVEKTGNVETVIRKNWTKYIDQAKFKSPLKERIIWYATNGELLVAKWSVCEALAEDHLRKAGARERNDLFERNKNMVVSEQPAFEQVKPYIIAALKTSYFLDLGDKDIPAFYDPTTGKIHILGDKVGLIAHEALHSYSSPEFREVLGADLDEGMAQYLSEEIEEDYTRFAKDTGVARVISAYGEQVSTVRELVDSGAIKRDDLLNAYFRGGKALLSQLKKARDKALKAKAAKQESEKVPQLPGKPQPPPKTPTPGEEKQLQRAPAHGASGSDAAPPIVHEVLRSPGQPLDTATRNFMEPRFGWDLGAVKVHTDTKAGESARAVNALAYTVGRDIVFGAQQYHPATQAGGRLLAHELTHVAQQTAGGSPQLQRTCDPQPLARPEFLKATGFPAKDAPFGFTPLAFGEVKYPAVVVEEVPAKKKGAKPVWTLSQTTTVLPDPIPSHYTVGIFEEETATALIVPQGSPCQGRYDRATYWVVGNMGNLLRDGEKEHCDDYQYAFDISLVKFAAAVNAMAGKDHCSGTKEKCEASFQGKLKKKTGVAPDQWPDVFMCLAKKSETVRDKRQLLHNPSTRSELTKDCKVRMVMTGLPGLGTPASAIIKCPEMGFTVPSAKTPAPAKAAPAKPAAKPLAGDK